MKRKAPISITITSGNTTVGLILSLTGINIKAITGMIRNKPAMILNGRKLFFILDGFVPVPDLPLFGSRSGSRLLQIEGC